MVCDKIDHTKMHFSALAWLEQRQIEHPFTILRAQKPQGLDGTILHRVSRHGIVDYPSLESSKHPSYYLSLNTVSAHHSHKESDQQDCR